MDLSAVLFDADGTIAETEDFHRISFNESFKEFGLSWYWDEAIYKELINVGGGKERITYHINRAWPEMLEYKNLNKYITSILQTKNDIFSDYMKESKIKPRPGILRLLKELKEKNIRTGLVSSASQKNLNDLFINGLNINPDDLFDVIAHGETTANKKPSPEIYEWALENLKLPSSACLAIEDSPRGLESASKAKIKVLITPSKLMIDENFDDAITVLSDLGDENKPFQLISGKSFGFKKVDFEFLNKVHGL